MSFDLAGDDAEDLVDARGSPGVRGWQPYERQMASLLETVFSRAPHVTRRSDPSGRALGWVEPARIPSRARLEKPVMQDAKKVL